MPFALIFSTRLGSFKELYDVKIRTGPVPVKNIVEQVGRVKSTVTGMVNNLEQNGYVTKNPSAEDGRVILVQLTDKGRALKPHFDQISKQLIDRVYGDMPQTEREILAGLLSRVRKNMEE